MHVLPFIRFTAVGLPPGMLLLFFIYEQTRVVRAATFGYRTDNSVNALTILWTNPSEQ